MYNTTDFILIKCSRFLSLTGFLLFPAAFFSWYFALILPAGLLLQMVGLYRGVHFEAFTGRSPVYRRTKAMNENREALRQRLEDIKNNK